jgi:hypothetical protein
MPIRSRPNRETARSSRRTDRRSPSRELRPIRKLVAVSLPILAIGAGLTPCASAHEAVKLRASALVPSPTYPDVIIGVNDAFGRGNALAEDVFTAGFTSDRIEPLVFGRDKSFENVPQIASEFGFIDNTVIVGDINQGGRRGMEASLSEWATEPRLREWTGRALREVEEAAKYGNTLMEVGNEMFLVATVKESRYPQPRAYAQMFVSLSKAVEGAQRRTKGYKLPRSIKLLFNLFGEYEESEGKWSKVALSERQYHGWLGDALEAPDEVGKELGKRIQGFTFHPYETRVHNSKGVWEAAEEPEHDWGTSGLKYDYEEAQGLGLGDLPLYVTELGFTTSGSVQAAEARAEYVELLSFPEVKGIWYFVAGARTEGKTGLFEGSGKRWKLDKAGEALRALTG